jgi:hypothetical protein
VNRAPPECYQCANGGHFSVSSLNHKALLLAFVEVSVPTALAAICALVEARQKPFLIRANNTTLSAPILHPNQPSASPVCTQQGFGVLPCRRCRWPVPAQTMSTTLKRPGDEQEAQLDESPRQHCSPTHNPTKPASLPFCWFFYLHVVRPLLLASSASSSPLLEQLHRRASSPPARMHLFDDHHRPRQNTNPTGRHHPDPNLDSAYQNLEDQGLDVSDIPVALCQPPPLFDRSHWARRCIARTAGLPISKPRCRS